MGNSRGAPQLFFHCHSPCASMEVLSCQDAPLKDQAFAALYLPQRIPSYVLSAIQQHFFLGNMGKNYAMIMLSSINLFCKMILLKM